MPEEKFKLLIVDDEEDLVSCFGSIFSKKGYTVFKATRSEDALDIFKREHPQICLMEARMRFSAFSGIELLRKMLEIDKSAYCIILSILDDQDTADEARRLGAKRYIMKPVEMTVLLKVLEEAKSAIENR